MSLIETQNFPEQARWIRLSDNERGDVVEFVGASIDVTKHHRARADLEKAFEEIKRLRDTRDTRLHSLESSRYLRSRRVLVPFELCG